MKHYKVKTKCGHVGNRKFIIEWFAIKADSKSDAAKKAKTLPRVKKQLKNCIDEVVEINKEEYMELIEQNNKDPYFLARRRRDVDLTTLLPFIEELPFRSFKRTFSERLERISYLRRKEKECYGRYNELQAY